MSTYDDRGQLILFATPTDDAGATRRPRRRGLRGPGGRPRMIERLDGLADQAEREAREYRRAGDLMRARAARDRAVGARRAAQILRAGPDGVAQIIDGSHPEAA